VLRIANYFESRLGRNDGNPLYVQACLKRMQYYSGIHAGLGPNAELGSWFADGKPDMAANEAAKALWEREKTVLEVDHIYPTGDLSPFGTYDLNVHVDWGEDGLTGVLPYTPIETPHPMAYWASDTHLGYDYRLSMAKKADFAFCAQKRAVEEFKRDGVANPIWLPHAVEPQAYPRFELLTKKYDVCFVGHVNSKNREDALDRLFSDFPNFYYGQQLFEDAARKFSESKICFNISMMDDLNMRTFEVMATGSFLLTNWIPTMEEVFEDGKHLVLYRSLDEMIDKAKYYLSHDAEREKIAQAGYEEVISKHTIQHRVSRILEEFMNSRRLANAGV
jgi:glycosyltransferase involved in cell wall biosynthesis